MVRLKKSHLIIEKSFMAQFVHKAFLLINKKHIQMNIKPLSDRVLVEPAQAETTTASGIIIPDTAQEKPQKGTIVAVGNGKIDEPLTVKVGDTVLYGKYSGTELKLEGKDYMIMRESDILAIL
jgi:chaperonin GroES